jgi:hypothetical protein
LKNYLDSTKYATVTVHSTVSKTLLTTSIIATNTDSIFTSPTSTVLTTVSPTTIVTNVVTVTTTPTVTLYTATAPNAFSSSTALAKRDIESTPIPAYASSCTDFADYSAACSAIGVWGSTRTVTSELPRSTVSETRSITELHTSTIHTTVDVTSTTLATITSSQTTTDIITQVTTSVVTQTSTVTAEVLPSTTVAISDFIVSMTPLTTGVPGYLSVSDGSIGITAASTAATLFTIDVENHWVLADYSNVVEGQSNNPDYYFQVAPPSFEEQNSDLFSSCACAVESNLTLSCTVGGAFVYYRLYTTFNGLFYTTADFQGDSQGLLNFPAYNASVVFQ